MPATYDKYYQTENLFGNPYPELIEFFMSLPKKGKVLDLGCGQGRDAIALARLGYTVTGIDSSKVGVTQMQRIAESQKLNLNGQVADIYAFENFADFDIVLLDSMLHFAKKDRVREAELISRILSNLKIGSLLVVCIQDTAKKVRILNETIDVNRHFSRIINKSFNYTFEDSASGHNSASKYRMIVVRK